MCIRDPGPYRGTCFNSTEEIRAEIGEFFLKFPELFCIFYILLFMVGECGNQNSYFLLFL